MLQTAVRWPWRPRRARRRQSAVFSGCDIARPWLPTQALWGHLLEGIVSCECEETSQLPLRAEHPMLLMLFPAELARLGGIFLLYSRTISFFFLLLYSNPYPFCYCSPHSSRGNQSQKEISLALSPRKDHPQQCRPPRELQCWRCRDTRAVTCP